MVSPSHAGTPFGGFFFSFRNTLRRPLSLIQCIVLYFITIRCEAQFSLWVGNKPSDLFTTGVYNVLWCYTAMEFFKFFAPGPRGFRFFTKTKWRRNCRHVAFRPIRRNYLSFQLQIMNLFRGDWAKVGVTWLVYRTEWLCYGNDFNKWPYPSKVNQVRYNQVSSHYIMFMS